MAAEPDHKIGQKACSEDFVEAPPEEVFDVDPAELFDPEEFGIRRPYRNQSHA